jgi:preprotein translocase subunit SecA
MTVRIQSAEQLDEAAQALEAKGETLSNVTYTAPTDTGEPETISLADLGLPQASAAIPRVGRNEPCPCGSGKKYKQCHGRLA